MSKTTAKAASNGQSPKTNTAKVTAPKPTAKVQNEKALIFEFLCLVANDRKFSTSRTDTVEVALKAIENNIKETFDPKSSS